MELIEYSLNDDIKKQLGYIIREERKTKYQISRDDYLIENNPYTKENICEGICHYTTYRKIEDETAKEDIVYHQILQRLDLYYQVSPEDHENNMAYIDLITNDLLNAMEYVNNDMVSEIKGTIEKIDFKNDCIADMHLKLLSLNIKLQLYTEMAPGEIDDMAQYIDFFDGLYKGLLHRGLGLAYLKKSDNVLSQQHCLEAKTIFDKLEISKGLINANIITMYAYNNDFLHLVPLCNEMEEYYKKTNNRKKLFHVYNYLSDYYLLINAIELAKDYFDKSNNIIEKDPSLAYYKDSLYYNWAYRCFTDYKFEEALEYFLEGYKFCVDNASRLQSINMILMLLIKLKHTDEEIKKFYSEGEKYFYNGTLKQQILFKYFRFRFKNSRYSRRYAYEKIFPILQNIGASKDILLFFYEDLLVF